MIKKRALLSVSDKTGIIELARSLCALDYEILSTGGTAKLLQEQAIPCSEVSSVTEFPEIMGGRVKTLHPKIHGGILARRGLDDEVMQQQDIHAIDIVVVNLYPFEDTIKDPSCVFSDAIENIDIGGPAMIRAAAKNHQHVWVVVNPIDYPNLLEALEQQQNTQALRFDFAKKAFAHTANYDASISNYLGTLDDKQQPMNFPDYYTSQYIKKQELRYGENPHQNAVFYAEKNPPTGSVTASIQLQGKELSYNNIADADAALECVKAFDGKSHCCVIVKHANPCGIACAKNQTEAYLRAFATDPTSSFGGIIAFNHPLSADTAQTILDKQFVEVIIAPQITDEAKLICALKRNIRVLECGFWQHGPDYRLDYKRINGGLLVQEYDGFSVAESEIRCVTDIKPSKKQLQDLLFAWNAVKFVKSNAIVYAKDQATVGVGAGQMSRVYSAKIAQIKASDENLNLKNSVMASDAFFPFRDSIDMASSVGVKAIIQPGGSIRDDEVIAAANEAKIAMLLTGFRHFKH